MMEQMPIEDAKSIFTRMFQTYHMLGLIDQHRDQDNLSVRRLYDMFLEGSLERRDEHFFLNHQFFMGSLLAFIVLPQQIYGQIPDTPLAELNAAEWGVSNLRVTHGGEMTLQHLCKKIRNAVSHGRLFVSNNERGLLMTMKDKYPNAGIGDFNFIAEIPVNDLMIFFRRFCRMIIENRL